MKLQLTHKILISITVIAFALIPVIASFAENANYIYDSNNRLIRVEYGDGRSVEYIYDEVGNLLQRVTSGPKILVSPASHNFGDVTVGSSSPPLAITISNIGTADLHISSIILSDTTNYSLNTNGGLNPCGSTTPTIMPGNNCTIAVTFSPTLTGQKDATLTTSSDDPDTPTLVTLTGNGVISPTVLTLISPNGSEAIPSSSIYTIRWAAPPAAVKFTLRYSINNGSKWKLIAKNITGSSYDWTVPIQKNNKKNCFVKVIGFNSSGTKVGEDISDSTFTIEVTKVTSPDGGETLTSGNTYAITWTTNGTIRPVTSTKLFYTINGGSKWIVIKTLTGNPGTYNWTVPNKPSSNCKVKVVLKDVNGKTVGNDISDGLFTIQP
jgi:YD repeat-containing protein